ncbi:Nucleolar complex protein 3 [Wickerhamomyces ciferrii]|uniref:Nucleolar complex-associated protein 3 n=1 Tax=Wickerhamomyces ciferrii (strain ATCC 14091 / BCRC 22168 / CBS 111 / JCM 3599 / NBRC 0793 / NRRL Y-1031 F-60-10) TaxID=1206466 RepID=K0L083_WICCF|nr:Nucleolar complex protein 3 [Wickerhamomyces ciferrii]CCH46813.1 Nucleolar complex protein 3 [Wickerhamomyces ciferrii]
MGKKRASRFVEEQRKKKKQEQDSLLSVGIANLANNANHNVNDSDEEQDYELKPRSLNEKIEDYGALPIKRGGKIERVVKIAEEDKDDEDDESESESEEDKEEEENNQEEIQKQQEQEEEEEPDTEEKILALKEEIAEIVGKLMEEPEENINMLTRLLRMAQSKNPNTSRFSLLALVPAFKSIIPGYRIRPLSDHEKAEKVSRDIQKLRNFEQTLIINYKNYIDLLSELAKNAKNDFKMAQFAVKAACELSSSFSDFNYRSDILLIVIRRICKPSPKNDPIFPNCIKTLEVLLNEDDAGDISFDIIRLLTKTLRSRKFKVDESVINIFLSANILNDYDPNASEEEKAEKLKLKKKDRVHLSKKERKARKERKEIEEEMRKAEQAVSAQEREKFQAEILKLLLKLYLDVLRENSQKLIAPVLEGLARIGHMANFDLLGDFLEVIREIIRDIQTNDEGIGHDESRHILLAIVTAFALVSNHSQYKVQVDLSSFVDSLYSVLYQVSFDADIEFSHKTLRLADPLSNDFKKPSVNVSTKIELLLRALENVFFKSKNGSKIRALAFSKRLTMILLNTPEKSSIAIIKFLEKLMARFSEIGGMFSTEDRIANGRFSMETDILTRSNPEAATIYEVLLLEKHYCPIVSKGAKSLLSRSKEN